MHKITDMALNMKWFLSSRTSAFLL